MFSEGTKRAAQGRNINELYILKSGMGVPAVSHFKNEFFISMMLPQEMLGNRLKNTIHHSIHIFFYKKGLFFIKKHFVGE